MSHQCSASIFLFFFFFFFEGVGCEVDIKVSFSASIPSYITGELPDILLKKFALSPSPA
jgi:hypothetical protein